MYFFMLLPVLYAKNIIDSKQVGYIGALMIACMVGGAFLVARWLHIYETKKLLFAGAILLTIIAAISLFGASTSNLAIVTVSYALSGATIGLLGSAVDSVTAGFTQKGNRYSVIAKIAVTTDAVRIILPVIIATALSLGSIVLSYIIVIVAAALLLLAAAQVPANLHAEHNDEPFPERLRHNKLFRYFLTIEFLDSFASSQLFVFLPILFLAKGYSVENSLIMQTSIFIGYMAGRLLVSKLANMFSGQSAVAVAEVGMGISILLLLTTSNLVLLYVLSFFLGVFTRGTSPAIKALTFDSLKDSQMKRGVAVYIMGGDSGSALAQLFFGLLVAWYGVQAPFILGAVVAASVAAALFFRPAK